MNGDVPLLPPAVAWSWPQHSGAPSASDTFLVGHNYCYYEWISLNAVHQSLKDIVPLLVSKLNFSCLALCHVHVKQALKLMQALQVVLKRPGHRIAALCFTES